jgi:hypothetical protein
MLAGVEYIGHASINVLFAKLLPFVASNQMIFLAACAKKHVANLWTEFAAHHVDAMATNGKECKNPYRFLVAATFEKAKTYVFAETLIWDREVGGSNPLAPTIDLKATE